MRRNEAVYKIQGNRNPFIDHPEYAEMIYCYDGKTYNSTLKNIVSTYGGYLDNSNVNPDPKPTPNPNPNPDIDNPAQAFTDSLAAIESATSLEERYAAIKLAIDAYNQMTAEEQAANAQGYEQLKQALNKYNQEVSTVNDDFDTANSLAAQMVCGISTSFMALVAIVVKRMLGGV